MVAHALRTAVAAVVSLVVARLFDLAEAYWAPVTTLVITQSSLGAALDVSWQRLIGTALGAIVGAVLGSYAQPTVLVFGGGVFVIGLLCALIRAERSAYRFGGVTLAVVLLVPRTASTPQLALHRFLEVSIGIGVALILTIVWPEDERA